MRGRGGTKLENIFLTIAREPADVTTHKISFPCNKILYNILDLN